MFSIKTAEIESGFLRQPCPGWEVGTDRADGIPPVVCICNICTSVLQYKLCSAQGAKKAKAFECYPLNPLGLIRLPGRNDYKISTLT